MGVSYVSQWRCATMYHLSRPIQTGNIPNRVDLCVSLMSPSGRNRNNHIEYEQIYRSNRKLNVG